MLNEKRVELERRMTQALEERDQCRTNLDEAQDRIMMLEKTKFEHEHKVSSVNILCLNYCWV